MLNAEAGGQVRDLIVRYAAFLDAQRREDVAACFASDVYADYDGNIFTNVEELISFAPPASYPMVYHFIGQIDVAEVRGQPSAETHITSHSVHGSDPSTLLIRGCRWLDDFRLEGDRYVMTRTIHRTDWSIEVPQVSYTPNTERLNWQGLP